MSFRNFRASRFIQRLNFIFWPNLDAQESVKVLRGTSLKDPSLSDDFLQIFVLMLKLKIFRFVDTDDVDIIKTFKIFEFQIKFYNLDKVGST